MNSPGLDAFLETGITLPQADTPNQQSNESEDATEPPMNNAALTPSGIDSKVIERILRRLADSTAREDIEGRLKALNQSTAAQLAWICDLLHFERSHIDLSKKRAKSELVSLLSDQVCSSTLDLQR